MKSSRRCALWAAVIALPLAACTKAHQDPAAAAQAAPSSAANRDSKPTTACGLLGAAEMSALLGGEVTQDPPRQDDTCEFSAARASGPSAELKFNEGDGQAAMMAGGIMNRHEPGMTDPLAGVGDQAFSVGPVVMIRRGEDLISLRITGVDDPIRRIKLVYGAIDAKL